MTDPEIAEAVAEIAARPPGDWAALLDARFPGDPELVRQATIWLTAGHALAPEAAAPSLGEHDERYELDRLLDTGATASVWLAYDRKLARNVAIKLFRAERSPALDALFAEARAACDIISDHVVRVLDVYAGDVPCIVMELVGEHDPDRGVLEPGTSAASCRPRDLTEAVRWVRGVALGVRDAHLRNVFHRDLKPHNVLITPFSRSAKIADFGLATRAAGATSPSGRHAAGTPGYLAPEQASGLTHALDPRDPADRAVLVGIDLWGLGAIAYDLIGGAPPWRSAGELEAWEVAASGAVPPPLERTRDGHRVPRRLRRIVERALSPLPADRYPSAELLARELDAFLARRPTTFDRSLASRAGLWLRRNPQLSATAAIAAGLGAMSLVAYTSVVRLREERAELALDMARVTTEKQHLAVAAREAQRELAETTASVREQSEALAGLRRALSEERADYHAIVASKEKALRTADAATRRLAEQLDAARGERLTAESGRAMYETFWTRARHDADEALRLRDAAQRDRDLAREHRAAAIAERDLALAALRTLEHERDAALADRARLSAELVNRCERAPTNRPANGPTGAPASTPSGPASAPTSGPTSEPVSGPSTPVGIPASTPAPEAGEPISRSGAPLPDQRSGDVVLVDHSDDRPAVVEDR